MIILTTSTSSQELKFIPREFVADSIILTDEQANTSTTLSATFTKDGYYLKADISFSLVEGRFYVFNAMNGSKIVYKGRIFCTDQTVADYSINDGIYTEHETTNDYIVYDE